MVNTLQSNQQRKKAPTTYEDDFGQRRYLTGPNEGKLVSEVQNSKKLKIMKT